MDTMLNARNHTAQSSARRLRVLAELLSALADVTRLGILTLLSSRCEVSVKEMCQVTGVPRPTLSHHLSILKITGLVTSRRRGRSVYYSLGALVSSPNAGELRIAAEGCELTIVCGSNAAEAAAGGGSGP
jgi:DNA-binding transcriptional ArsR family regulator